tara:strand:+ start:1962 stop:2387 length:426 start_codon:yes stop_codon:yes gene_type:complete
MFFKTQKEEKDKFKSIDIAICSLLIHTAKTDDKFDKQEKKLIEEYLLKLGNKKEYINQLFQYCEIKEKNSVEILEMTKEIKKLDYQDRLEIVEMMLKIIYSDQHLCNYEDRLIRKVSGLIYIESKDLGEIRLKVKNDLHSK